MESTADPNKNHNCSKCNRSDSADNMVGCDLCGRWAHFECAGVTDSIGDPDRSWKCDRCRAAEATEVASHRSRSSRRSRTSHRSRQEIQLDLQQLEEEQRLRLKHLEEEEAARKKAIEEEERARLKRMEEERRFLKDRFEILRAGIDNTNDVDSKRSSLSSRASREKVQEWLSRERGCTNQSTVVPPLSGQAGTQRTANPTSISQIDASADATIVDPPAGVVFHIVGLQQRGVLRILLLLLSALANPNRPRFRIFLVVFYR